MGRPAVAAERGIDRVGRGEDEAVRAAAVAIRRQDDERPLPDDVEWSDELGDRVWRDERQVDRQEDDRVGAAGDRVVPRLAEPGVESALARWRIVRAPRNAACSIASRSGLMTSVSAIPGVASVAWIVR